MIIEVPEDLFEDIINNLSDFYKDVDASSCKYSEGALNEIKINIEVAVMILEDKRYKEKHGIL